MSFRPRLLVLVNSKIIFHPWLSRRQAWPIDPHERSSRPRDPPVNHQIFSSDKFSHEKNLPGISHVPYLNIPWMCKYKISHRLTNQGSSPLKSYILIQHNPTVGEIILHVMSNKYICWWSSKCSKWNVCQSIYYSIPRNTVNSLSEQQQFTYLDTFTHLVVVALKQIIVSGHHILIQFLYQLYPNKKLWFPSLWNDNIW